MMNWKRAVAPAVALLMALSPTLPSTGEAGAAAPAGLPSPPHTALQTADRFLAIAYRYKGWWFPDHGRNMGKRDVRYASSTLDKVLRRVKIELPIAFPNKDNWYPGTGVLKTRRALPDGTVAMGVRVPVTEKYQGLPPEKFHIYAHLHVRKIRGYWKVVGVELFQVSGPDRYCPAGGPTGQLDCSIFPAGSD